MGEKNYFLPEEKMPFCLVQPNKKQELTKTPTIRIEGRQLHFNRKATGDIFSDKPGYVQFYLDPDERLLGIKPVNSPENAFAFRVYRRKVSPTGVVFAAEMVAKVLKITGTSIGTFSLIKDTEAGLYVGKLI
jgi:hypothetical protein